MPIQKIVATMGNGAPTVSLDRIVGQTSLWKTKSWHPSLFCLSDIRTFVWGVRQYLFPVSTRHLCGIHPIAHVFEKVVFDKVSRLLVLVKMEPHTQETQREA